MFHRTNTHNFLSMYCIPSGNMVQGVVCAVIQGGKTLWIYVGLITTLLLFICSLSYHGRGMGRVCLDYLHYLIIFANEEKKHVF